ncbi:MAG: hypothetical protein IJ651_09575 [Bacteroidales bacterium]|nr:hypothetical protein [Bacteroidales bacterium]
MKNEVFDFGRFWNYFKFDLKQMWRNHSRPAIVIGGMGLIVYVIWVLMGLIFGGGVWQGPSLGARIVVMAVAFIVLMFYQTRTYGYLTDRRQGSSWLMIPASSTEKFVSMLLITLLVIPILFVVVFFCVDFILSIADPTVGQSILGAVFSADLSALGDMSQSESMFMNFSKGPMAALMVISLINNFLFFLLCGLCFKRYKILGAIGVTFAVEVVLSILGSIFIPMFADNLVYLEEESAFQMMNGVLNAVLVFSIVVVLALAAGIFFRIKTIKH